MEIERKFTVKRLPERLEAFPARQIEQAYLCVRPVVRIRRQDEAYYLTYKGEGMCAREEYNLPLDRESYAHLLEKADGSVIAKTRYLIPASDGLHTIELDVFAPPFAGLVIAEVEFASREEAERYQPEDWFDEDVTYNEKYHNSYLSRCGAEGIPRA